MIWIRQDGRHALGCESVFHFERAFEIYAQIKAPSPNYLTSLTKLIKYPWLLQVRQPAVSAIPSTYAAVFVFLSILFNLSFLNLAQLNIIYLALIILFTYLLGKSLSCSKTGLLSAFLIAFYPMVYGASRKLTPEIALTAIVVCAYYLLVKTNFFKSISYSIVLGITCLFGIMIHPLFAAFISGGLLYCFFKIIKFTDKAKPQRFLNLITSILIMLASLFFMHENFHKFNIVTKDTFKEMSITLTKHSQTFIGNADTATDGLFLFASPEDSCPCTQTTSRGINLKCILFYLAQIPDQISFFCVFLLITSLFFFVKNKNCKGRVLLFLWAIFPYLILTLLPRKWGRFYMPALPALALITACGISSITDKRFKKILLVLILIVSFMQFFAYSYYALPGRPFLSELTEFINTHKPFPSNYHFTVSQIMKQINNSNIPDQKQQTTAGLFDLVTSADRFSSHWYNDLTYYFRLLMNFYKRADINIALNWDISTSIIDNNSYDFLVVLSDDDYVFDDQIIKNYQLMQKYTLKPSNIIVITYKKKL
ncbi:MAG: glycosyltransferase family 39 protein [Candidatus Omnitrophota bacterium]